MFGVSSADKNFSFFCGVESGVQLTAVLRRHPRPSSTPPLAPAPTSTPGEPVPTQYPAL